MGGDLWGPNNQFGRGFSDLGEGSVSVQSK